MASTDALQRKRLRLLLNLFIVFLAGLVFLRLGYWMIIKSSWLREKARVQWIRELPVEPQRGNIEDRNGNILAASVASNTVVLHPKAIKEDELDDLVNSLHEILGIDKNIIEEKAKKTNYSVVWLKRQISQEQSQQIKELGSGGVSLAEDKKRYYPLGSFLTQVLGFTSVDGEGLEGIESRFDYILHGTPGSIVTETDRDGQPLPGASEEYTDPIEGNNLRLTIDLAIQSYTEKALNECIDDTGAKSAMAIVMNCNTGEILAMSNKPDFDNNSPPRNDMELLRSLTRNSAISDPFEPGNIFGIFTAATALDAGDVGESYIYDCDGDTKAHGKEIVCWSQDGHGSLNLTEVFETGCNLAFADIAMQNGLNDMYEYIYNFGFGQKTEVKLYGESQGNIISPKYITEYELARIGYGQDIKVTGIQLANAFSALVNGGKLMKPYIVKHMSTPEGEILESYGTEIVQSVISYETSARICEYLNATAQSGNAIASKINGYNIGAFAGIAQKYDSQGTIVEGKHTAVYLAAAPIDDPKYIVMIAVDEPGDGAGYGAWAAAPYGNMIWSELLPYASIMADPNYVPDTNQMPDLYGLSAEEAKEKLRDRGLTPFVMGYSGDVIGQIPDVGEDIERNSTAIILLENEDDQNENIKVEVPNLSGMGALEAYEALKERGLEIRIKTSGSVVQDQFPWSGEYAYAGDVIDVYFTTPPEDTEQEE